MDDIKNVDKWDKDLIPIDSFLEKIYFIPQSKLAIALGIIAILVSSIIFIFKVLNQGLNLVTVIEWLVFVFVGIVLIKLGSRMVPHYGIFVSAIQNYVQVEIKKLKESK